jgi:hypothetical protein
VILSLLAAHLHAVYREHYLLHDCTQTFVLHIIIWTFLILGADRIKSCLNKRKENKCRRKPQWTLVWKTNMRLGNTDSHVRHHVLINSLKHYSPTATNGNRLQLILLPLILTCIMEQIYLQNQSRGGERGLPYLAHYILKLIFLKYLFWYHWCSVTLKIGAKHFLEML